MELLGDLACVESRFSPFGDSVMSVQLGAWFKPNEPQAWKSFWTHMMELLGDVGHVESRFGPFGDGVTVDAR
jgi:hypothetical protein